MMKMPTPLTLSAFKDHCQAGHRHQDLKLALAFVLALGCPHFQESERAQPWHGDPRLIQDSLTEVATPQKMDLGDNL